MAQVKSKLLIATIALLVLAVESSGKQWRGITPLHSRRDDVVRLFNQCADATRNCEFGLENERVSIVFSGNATGEFDECGADIPAHTVLQILVTLDKPLRLKGQRINYKSFRRFDSATPRGRGYMGYIDDKAGLILQTYRGRILQFVYFASAKDKPLCPSYYENPASIIQIGPSHFCPPISVICPSNKPAAGDKITFAADADPDANTTLTWKVSAGKIIEGQGTRVITVDTAGLDGQTIWATVTRGGQCSLTGICSVVISPK